VFVQGSTSTLTVDKIEGIFHILGAGIAAGVVIVMGELLITAKLNSTLLNQKARCVTMFIS